MKEELSINRKLWDEWAVIHERSAYYSVESFKEGRNTLSTHEFDEIGDVNGRSLIHLMCHIGLDTMSLSRMGARATGIDFSPRSIDVARSLAREIEVPTRFIESDIYDAASVLHGEVFDFVYTSHGILAWLPDLSGWAKVIVDLLKPGGTFYLSEIHPFSQVLAGSETPLEARHPYFFEGASEWATEGSYVDRSAQIDTEKQYQWQHTLGDVVNALINAGFVIEFLHEFPFALYKQVDAMQQDSEGLWRTPGPSLPFLFSLRAHLQPS